MSCFDFDTFEIDMYIFGIFMIILFLLIVFPIVLLDQYCEIMTDESYILNYTILLLVIKFMAFDCIKSVAVCIDNDFNVYYFMI